MDCYLGIDFGTSGARAIVIDAETHVCAQVSQRFTDSQTQDQATTWRSLLFTLIQQLPERVRGRLRAIAINGTSSTVLLCDSAGQPLTAPLLYNDAIGAAELATLQELFATQPDAPCQSNVCNATSSLVKLLWWQRQPVYAQAKYFLHQADWLAFLLHGQLGISDYHNSLKLGYDVHRLTYPDWLMALDVSSLLPHVLPPGTPVGTIQPMIAADLGLPTDCQICTGTTDSIAAFLASGATQSGQAVTSLGSTLVLKLLSHTAIENATYGIYSHRLGDRWLVGGASNTGGAVLQQFFTPLELATLSQQIPVDQPSPLDYYPLLQPGERFPINDPNLSPRLEPQPRDRVAFLHGLLESIGRIEAQGYHLLHTLGATPLTQVYTAGGGANNPTWTVIRQRLLGVPVVSSLQTEAAYGTALLARKTQIHSSQ
ncbi:FGGY-family carbohydrate kinase [Pantanalinema sp. GBBB05]|uniref:FGGY-family carbohydrate kinase n=1 Tax=Pantanalinema sp. GBBB05 TaxID=2604139 RepID=UPI001D6F2F0C|nr:FGGY-family carbohydrate kinase [Pantanalinema sp. GBBB05]